MPVLCPDFLRGAEWKVHNVWLYRGCTSKEEMILEIRRIIVSWQGLPLSLSGVRRIMENMDWGDVFDFVSFGNVGSDHLDESAYYVIVAPQNVVGSTIMTKLLEMVRYCSES